MHYAFTAVLMVAVCIPAGYFLHSYWQLRHNLGTLPHNLSATLRDNTQAPWANIYLKIRGYTLPDAHKNVALAGFALIYPLSPHCRTALSYDYAPNEDGAYYIPVEGWTRLGSDTYTIDLHPRNVDASIFLFYQSHFIHGEWLNDYETRTDFHVRHFAGEMTITEIAPATPPFVAY